jgi:hypothetical protein
MKDESPERRTIEELAALCEFEPTLRALYVEGVRDRGFWQHVVACHMPGVDVVVYDIDVVQVESDALVELDLPNSRRGRVIALGHLIPGYAGLTCVADSDFDWLLGSYPSSPAVLYTDFTSKDLYAFDEVVVQKFLRVVLCLDATQYRGILDVFDGVLRELFYLRTANVALNWNMEWLSPRKLLERVGRGVRFDREVFVERYLHKNGRLPARAEFEGKLRELREIAVADRRYVIRGGDYFELLAWYLADNLPGALGKYRDADVLGQALLGAIEGENLKQSEVCARLRARLVP